VNIYRIFGVLFLCDKPWMGRG